MSKLVETYSYLPKFVQNCPNLSKIVQNYLNYLNFTIFLLSTGLMKLLMIESFYDEVEMLKSFPGDKSKLGNAEKFILQLVGVSK